MQMKNRDLVWDAVKGVAIILMVIGHSGCPVYLRRFIYLFHMGVFFYVSGRYLNIKGVDVLHFLKKKGYSLYVPFVKWGGAYSYSFIIFFTFWDGMNHHIRKLKLSSICWEL